MGRKATFAFLDKVELFVRTGTFPADASKSSRKVTRAASKRFSYKDGCLWRHFRGRLLQVVRSDEEVREILTRYHDNNNHAGQGRAVKEIMMMYYWAGVTPAVKKWIKACALCQSRTRVESQEPPIQSCLAYSCEATSYIYPELTFFKFPKDAELRRKWLVVAQRDEGSLRTNSYLCSKHFESSCFTLNENGQLTLSPDAVPTISPVVVTDNEVPIPSDEDFLDSTTLAALLSISDSETTDPTEPVFGHSEIPVQLQEHQYCLPAPNPYSRTVQAVSVDKERKTNIEPSFRIYDQIARYLSHRVLPLLSKKNRGSFIRSAKRFGLIDGVLMYMRSSPPVRVARSREEVNSILQQFHDSQNHAGQGVCQQEIAKHFYWRHMTRDLASWIASCHTCLSRTKRKWLRCSIYSCTNCCGPVERGLGLTFHKFPLHNSALLAQWLKAVGRPHWHPRLRSSICSTHFTEDCFDHSGDKVILHPDAVPTLFVHRDTATQSSGPAQPPVGEEAYFAKFDAVELYLRRRIYPPGLSYVEKNTFRRFCKNFAIKGLYQLEPLNKVRMHYYNKSSSSSYICVPQLKHVDVCGDDALHMVKRDRVRLVLRNRQQVEVVLNEYHNELNHLDVNKCLRLLNERFFWKTMRPDVAQWINKCSQCNKKKMNKPEKQREPGRSKSLLLRSPQIHGDSDSGKDDDDYKDDAEDDGGDADEGGERAGDEETQPAANSADTVMGFSASVSRENLSFTSPPQSGTSIILRLKAPNNFQSSTSDTAFVARLVKTANPPPKRINTLNIQLEGQHSQTELQEETQAQDHQETIRSQGSARTHHCIAAQGGTKPPTEPHPPPEFAAKLPQSTNKPNSRLKIQTWSSHRVQQPVKRRRVPEAGPSAKRSSSCGLEPVVAPSTKPWPVFTISGSVPAQGAESTPGLNSAASAQRPEKLQARTIIQQCTQAKVRIRPALDGSDAQWAEIQEGMVVYVCFFDGATEGVTYEMANSLMTTRFFRKGSRQTVSLLDLPGVFYLSPRTRWSGSQRPRKRCSIKICVSRGGVPSSSPAWCPPAWTSCRTQ
ncbi:uncharacterized protein LOC113148173 isoform X2 [Anabas testudineus]|uniref:uncharacterized protein LOC113148173 isoform X2 n=1 Tax=Anabas testudineus TaxID=64144 RepID=UPI000E454EE0|nr:uncharacterized protein LOC113148173 isoform X2 [Anabas testudineus]